MFENSADLLCSRSLIVVEQSSKPSTTLDEPFLSLDPHFHQATVALVKRIQQDEGITILFTAHELNSLLDAMDRSSPLWPLPSPKPRRSWACSWCSR